jgi:O-antigen/teichoic acid export membrane protein
MILTLVKGALKILSNRSLGIALNLFSLVLLTRITEQATVGTILIFTSIYFPLSVLLRFGLEQTMLKFAADAYPSHAANNLLRAKILKSYVLISGTLILVFFVGVQLLVEHDSHQHMFKIFAWAWLSALSFILSEQLLGNRRFFIGSMTKNSIAPMITSSCFLYFYLSKSSIYLDDILSVYIISFAVTSLIVLKLVLNIGTAEMPKQVQNINIKLLVTFSIPLLFVQSINFLNAQSDIWFIASSFDRNIVAYYGVAAKIVFFVSFFLTISSAALAPYVAQYRQENKLQQLQLLAQKIATIALLPGLTFFILIQIFAETILNVLYGPDYTQGANILRIASAGQLIGAIVGPCGYLLIMFEKGRQIARLSIFTTLVLLSMMYLGYALELPIEFFAFSTASATIIYQLGLWHLCKTLCSIKSHVSFGVFNVR